MPTAHARAQSRYRAAQHEMPGDWDFRLLRIRRGQPRLNLREYVESVDWSDEGLYGSGSVSLRKPSPDINWYPLTKGDLVRVDAWYRKRWRQIVTMRVEDFPESDSGEGMMSVTITDDLSLLARQKRDWNFRKTKQRGRGYYPGEIARAVAKKEGLRIGNVHRGKHRIDKLEKKDTHGLDVILAAYEKERAKTGKRYITRIRDNKLEIEPYHHSTYTYVLDEAVEAASVTRKTEKANPATVWLGKGRTGKGSKAKKIRFRYKRQKMVRRFGMKEKEKDYGRVNSMADLRKQVKADYADEIKVHKAGTVTVTGMPFLRGSLGSLRKGMGVIIVLRGEGMTRGKRSRFWTTGVRHSVDGGSYTTEIEFADEDPWLAYQEEQDKFAREQKRKERK